MPKPTLYRVTCAYFCAGLIIDPETEIVIATAPILKWARGQSLTTVEFLCRRRDYAIKGIA